MTLTEKEKKKIDVLLAEYQACHTNRNHYDSIRWIIGSIFIAISWTLYGVSFLKEVKYNFTEVTLIAFFSVVLTSIWYSYFEHVDPYVMISIKRSHEIELELDNWGFDVNLQYSVSKAKQRIRGILITYFLLLALSSAWLVRVVLFFEGVYALIWLIVGLPVLAFVLCLIHIEILSSVDWRKEIKKIDQRRKRSK